MATQPLSVAPGSAPSTESQTQQIAADNSLFDIDRELDMMLDTMDQEIEETGEASNESMERFTQFCNAFGEKVDRIGGFIRIMEARANYCKAEAERLAARGKAAENKAKQMKGLVLYYLASHEMTKVEGHQYTLRRQKNGQDSVKILDDEMVHTSLRRMEAVFEGQLWRRILAELPSDLAKEASDCVRRSEPSPEAIRRFVATAGPIEGVEVKRDYHLRVA